MIRQRVTEVRDDFSRAVSRVEFAGERIILERCGREVAALVPMDDLRLLEEMEDRALIRAADEAEASATRELSLDEMNTRLGM